MFGLIQKLINQCIYCWPDRDFCRSTEKNIDETSYETRIQPVLKEKKVNFALCG